MIRFTFAPRNNLHMKFLFIAFFSAALLTACNSGDSKTEAQTIDSVKWKQDSIRHANDMAALIDSANYTSIQWIDSMHQDLGTVNDGAQVEVSWRFKNTGTKPLIIATVNPGCGCTVADKPEAPVMPGEEGRIKAKFDSKDRKGTQNKDLYVTANTTGSQGHTLSFGVVVK